MSKSHPVSIGSETHALAGSLVLPDQAARENPAPGALIVGGPGPLPLGRYTAEGARQWPAIWSEALGKESVGALCFDQRGSGLSGGVYHDADWSALYDDVRGAAEMLAVQPEIGRTVAIAWGDGCGFALQLAAEGKVGGLVLMAPAFHNEEERYMRSIQSLAAKKGLSDRVVQVRVNQWRQEVAAAARRVEQGERTSTVDLGGQQVTTNLVRFLQTVVFDASKLVGQVQVPVLVLHGGADQVIQPEESADLAQALGTRAERIVYPGVGHFLYEHPRAMADAAAWIRRLFA